MILDYDHKDLTLIKKSLDKMPKYLFRIYETNNGYHVFLVSMECPYYYRDSWRMMMFLDCDPFYASFCFKYGYTIRLSPKINEWFNVKFIEEYGFKLAEIPEKIKKMIKVHDQLINKFSNKNKEQNKNGSRSRNFGGI